MDGEKIKAKLHDYFCDEAGIVLYESDRDAALAADLIDLLHIGRIVVSEYPDMASELRGDPATESIRYDSDSINEDDCISNRTVLPAGTIIMVTIYPTSGYVWNEEEKELVKGFLLIFSTIKSRIRMKEFIDYAVFHELELGFNNSFYLTKMMGMVERLEKTSEYSVIFFNLVNLSGLNTLLGRKETDKVIIKFTNAVISMLEQPETLCRVGGDNFCLLIKKEKTEAALEILAGIHIDVENPEVKIVKLGAYCGIYSCTGYEKTIQECIDYAQSSMLIAKNEKHAQIQYYDESMVKMMIKVRDIESRFKVAIRNEEFMAYYQPKVNLETNKLIGAEALCRWKSGDKFIMPDEFIPVLEKSKRICILDFYILEHVCADISKWMSEGKTPVRVSSNFSRKHLSNPNFVNDVIEIVDKYGVPHSLIVIEVTETTEEADMKRLKEVVDDFRKAGFDVSVDDFGAGYSSMSMIKDIPFCEIKIDKSFLLNENLGYNDMVMMKHIISLARDLGMSTIAEGVENPEQIKLLRKNGCIHGQGYFFDKPLPREEFEKVLTDPDYEGGDQS